MGRNAQSQTRKAMKCHASLESPGCCFILSDAVSSTLFHSLSTQPARSLPAKFMRQQSSRQYAPTHPSTHRFCLSTINFCQRFTGCWASTFSSVKRLFLFRSLFQLHASSALSPNCASISTLIRPHASLCYSLFLCFILQRSPI